MYKDSSWSFFQTNKFIWSIFQARKFSLDRLLIGLIWNFLHPALYDEI